MDRYLMLCCRPVSHLIIPACSSSLRSRLFNFVRFGSSLFSLYFFHCFLVSSCLKRFYLLSSLELSRLSSKISQPGSVSWKFCYTRHSHREISTNFSSSLSTGRERHNEKKRKREEQERLREMREREISFSVRTKVGGAKMFLWMRVQARTRPG